MFGNNGDQMAHLVKKHQWNKVFKKLEGADAKAKIALASACGDSSDEEASNTLITLLTDNDEGVLLQAVKSLGAVGHDNAKTHLMTLSNSLVGEKKEIREAISNAISQIRERK